MTDLDTPRPESTSEGGSRALSHPPSAETKPLSPWVKPLVWLHRLVSGDRAQHAEWRARLESIEQAAAIDAEPSTEGKALLADRRTYRQIRTTSLVASSGMMSLGAVWMASLIPVYWLGWGFGPWSLAYLLPVPLAWRLGRKMWDRAALQGMKELGDKPTPQQQLRTLSAGMVRGMAAGAGMGFSLVFLQALISWFMTPAPTLGLELTWDLFHGSMGAAVGAMAGAIFGPLASRPAPGSTLADGREPAGFLPSGSDA